MVRFQTIVPFSYQHPRQQPLHNDKKEQSKDKKMSFKEILNTKMNIQR